MPDIDDSFRYFEVCIGKGPDEDEARDTWLCVKTKRPAVPSKESLTRFLARDLANHPGDVVVRFYLIDENTARECYDFSNESSWPVFTTENERAGDNA